MNKENISKVYLLSVPLDSTYKNTLYFGSKSSQQSYFEGTIQKSYTGFTYLRKDNLIYVPDHIDNIYNVNYVMYQNTYYKDKWFYAFIKDMKYESDDCTIIEIETDVIQTWLFDYQVKQSFVEREHISNDKLGDYTYPEGLETGEYIVNNKIVDDKGNRVMIGIAITDYDNDKLDVKGALYGGLYSGMAYRCYDVDNEGIGVSNLNKRLNSYDDSAKADAINSMFMFPRWLYTSHYDVVGDIVAEGTIPAHTTPKGYSIEIDKQTKINGYTPRNKKLLTYPYNYLYASNNAGASAIYHYEQFNSDKCKFDVKGVVSPGCSIRMNPLNYKGVSTNNDEGINGGKYPICCWNSDAYTNWLTQNGVNIGLNLLSGAGQIVAGAGLGLATGGLGLAIGGGSIAGGISTITGTLSQVHQQSMIPDQVKGNTNCGDVITGSNQNCFMFYQMSIKKEYAEIIDNYFDMFGYKVNRVKVPNSNHMSRYWYTKTIDANIDGSIPTNDLNKIKNCYDSGITFWRSASNMFVYPSSNEDGTINNSNR